MSGPNQVVDEGAPLTVTNIGKFVDPTPVGIRRGQRSGRTRTTTRSIGATGLTVDSGQATMQAPVRPTCNLPERSTAPAPTPTTACTPSRSRSPSPDGRVDVATFQVTVNNVAPTLAPIPDQTVGQTRPLDLPNVGQFTDPGFDNPLNVGGETTERFTVRDQLGRRYSDHSGQASSRGRGTSAC